MNVREWALPVYTILMQLAVGTLLMLWIVRTVTLSRFGIAETDRITRFPIVIIFLTVIVAVIGAHFHLSRPQYSLLAVLNFRTSWLSREIVFTVLVALSTGFLTIIEWFAAGRAAGLKTALGWVAILLGLAGVYCMSCIYLLPTQAAWNSPLTTVSFYLTMLLLGCMAMPAVLLVDLTLSTSVPGVEPQQQRIAIIHRVLTWSTGAAAVVWCGIVALSVYQISMLRLGDKWAQTSFGLLTNLYQPLLILRSALPFLGITWLVISLVRIFRTGREIKQLTVPVYMSCIAVLAGEILGRFLFYATHVRIGV